MEQKEEDELKRIANDVENHRMRFRKNRMGERLGQALEDDSDDESSDEEDEMARIERYKNIDEQRRLQALTNAKPSAAPVGETIEEVDIEVLQEGPVGLTGRQIQ